MPCSAIEKGQARGRKNGWGISSKEKKKKLSEDERIERTGDESVFQLEDSLGTTVNHFLSFLEIDKLPGPVLFSQTHIHVRTLCEDSWASEYGWKAYPDKHVKFWFTPFLNFFYLHLACMANIQVVDSWPPSVPAESGPHFASINLTMELILQPTWQQFFGIIILHTCCKDDPTHSVAALLLSHQWMLLCWVVHLKETAKHLTLTFKDFRKVIVLCSCHKGSQ